MGKGILSAAKRQAGYTLIELLLYMALSGMLLTAVVGFFSTITEARVKNQTVREVNDQGAQLMDLITQTIRNATGITTPTAGANSASLTLTVPTAGLSPTIFDSTATTLGYTSDGDSTDSAQTNFINATKFTAGTTGSISKVYTYIGEQVAASPNNLAKVAVYSGATPTTLLASSGDTVITPNTWIAFEIPTITVTSGQTYWLAYNTNGLVDADNNLRQHAGTSGQTIFVARNYSLGWPASWTGTPANFEMSMYAPIATAASSVARIKEGAGSNVSLTNDNVRISGLDFKNLTRGGTLGAVRVKFTLSRINPNDRGEYDYQKTFIGTAEVQW